MGKNKLMNKYTQIFNLKNKKIFIVGGSGLIGSQIVKALYDFGADITVFDLEIKKKLKKKIKLKN